MFQKVNNRRMFTFALFSILRITLASSAAGYTMMGNVNSYQEDGCRITFNCENGKVRLSFLKEDLVRVHMAPAGKEFPADDLHANANGPYAVVTYTWPGVSYRISEEFDADLEGVVHTIRAGKLVVKVRKQPFKLAFCDAEGNLLVMEKEGIIDAGLGYADSRVYETMHLQDDEHFFGFGAHNHPLDMRGHKIVCYAKELEKHHDSGGFPVPFFYSTRGYGIFFNNLDDDVTFEMGTTDGQYSFSATSGGMEGWDMDYYVIYGPAFADILNRYTDIVGKPILPQKWYFGHIQVHCTWLEDKIIEAANKYRQADWPVDVFVMDFGSLGPNFTWASGHENPANMYKTLDKYGIKTAFSCALFDDIYNWKGFDPTKKADMDKYFAAHLPRIRDGMDFWRQDNGERSMQYTGLQKFANGYEAHNLFGSLWAKTVVEGMASQGLYGRPVISRGGPIGGHRYIIPWPGDTPHGLQFLDVDLNYFRNGGLAGYSSISADLGGFTNRGKGEPLEEQNVMRRIVNMMPVAPVAKFQGANDASAPFPWLFTEQQQDLFRFYLKLRYRLHPYYYSSAIEAHITGRPILAPLVFDYQDDANTYDKDFHFMLGREILVAPVMEKTGKWNVYLPKGKWIHYWTDREYPGGQTVMVDAPLYGRDGLPVFVKAGAIIPMMPLMSYIYEKAPDPITIDVYPDKTGRSKYVMYDCDTVKGPFKETTYTCLEDEKNMDISITPSNVAYELWVHYGKEPVSVLVDSKQSPQIKNKCAYDKAEEGWYFGPGCFYGNDKTNTINIRIPKSPTAHLIQIKK
ncbi:MAG TPA: TIM-barrel domain-containing protein [Sedimentisphaerales bacterium]|nr:TIM-barrel domain-containing protein [Sedimentisphaerales bacterium]